MKEPHLHAAGPTAVVIGAGVAGLLAARVLSSRYSVTVVERDILSVSDSPAPRAGAPQSRQAHLLLSGATG